MLFDIVIWTIVIFVFFLFPIGLAIWVGRKSYKWTKIIMLENELQLDSSRKYEGSCAVMNTFELCVYSSFMIVAIFFSYSEIYIVPWSGVGFSVEKNLIEKALQCGAYDEAVNTINTARNSFVFTLLGIGFILYRCFPWPQEFSKRLFRQQKGWAVFILPFLILIGIVFLFARLISQYEAEPFCSEKYYRTWEIFVVTANSFSAALFVLILIFWIVSFYVYRIKN